MRYSQVVDGKVLDYYYKQTKLPWGYNFYIGNIFIGQIFRGGCNKWSCISFHTPSKLCPVHGFSTRLDASEFLLKVCGFRGN